MEQVSFKVSLSTEKDPKSQIRRFEVPQDCSTSYIYLKEKLRSIFPQELENSGFKITWQDQEGDIVTIDTDEELFIAMNEIKGPVFKFDIVPLKVRNYSYCNNTNFWSFVYINLAHLLSVFRFFCISVVFFNWNSQPMFTIFKPLSQSELCSSFWQTWLLDSVNIDWEFQKEKTAEVRRGRSAENRWGGLLLSKVPEPKLVVSIDFFLFLCSEIEENFWPSTFKTCHFKASGDIPTNYGSGTLDNNTHKRPKVGRHA